MPAERVERRRGGADDRQRRPMTGRCSGVDCQRQLGGLRLALVPGRLQDRRDVRVGHEALPALRVPVEGDPHAIALGGIAEHDRALRAMLPALVGAAGGEHFQEAVEVLDLRGCEQHGYGPLLGGFRTGPQAAVGTLTCRSWGSMAPSSSTTWKRPSLTWAMYMFMRTWCSPGITVAGPPGPSSMWAWSSAATTSACSSVPASATAAAHSRSPR